LLLTLVDVVLVARGGGNIQISVQAVGFGLTAGFCYSLYYIFGKYFSTRYSSPNLFFYLLSIGALTIVPWVEFTDNDGHSLLLLVLAHTMTCPSFAPIAHPNWSLPIRQNEK